jgi:hypothetical protein
MTGTSGGVSRRRFHVETSIHFPYRPYCATQKCTFLSLPLLGENSTHVDRNVPSLLHEVNGPVINVD